MSNDKTETPQKTQGCRAAIKRLVVDGGWL